MDSNNQYYVSGGNNAYYQPGGNQQSYQQGNQLYYQQDPQSENEEDSTPELLDSMAKKHNAVFVMIEYTGMWQLSSLYNSLP